MSDQQPLGHLELPSFVYIHIPTIDGVVRASELARLEIQESRLKKILCGHKKWSPTDVGQAFLEFKKLLTDLRQNSRDHFPRVVMQMVRERGLEAPEDHQELLEVIQILKTNDQLVRYVGRYFAYSAMDLLEREAYVSTEDKGRWMLQTQQTWARHRRSVESICNEQMKEAFEPYRSRGYPVDEWQGSIAAYGPAGDGNNPSYRIYSADVVDRMWKRRVPRRVSPFTEDRLGNAKKN